MNMHTHLITPHAPLVLRTGKPFGETGGGDTFSFPLPSTVAGALRTAQADAGKLDFTESKATIQSWASHAALAAALGSDGEIAPLFPRPADARYVRPDKDLTLQRLAPAKLQTNEGCDLPDGLLPVFLDEDDKSKPAPGPDWWTETAIHAWLLGNLPEPKTLGPEPFPIDTRSHVALDPSTLAASSGQLFQSAGPDFGTRRRAPDAEFAKRGWKSERYGLLARFAKELQPTLVRLGGEARLAAVSPCDAWPRLPDGLKEELKAARHIRLILATPALFSGGWKPGWLGDDLTGSPPCLPDLVLQLKAAAIDRWQAVSGWDLVALKPKAIRRLAPAGSVYWFEVVKYPPDWAERLWLAPISDSEQDGRDGFGLVVPGIWKN
jgi:CRISPR-associated protein Cmr3